MFDLANTVSLSVSGPAPGPSSVMVDSGGSAFYAAVEDGGELELPLLHASSLTGEGTRIQGYGWSHGVQQYTWTGLVETSLPLVGLLDFEIGGSDLAFVSAGLAIIDADIGVDVLATWFNPDAFGGFGFDCGSGPGALAIAETGAITSTGLGQATLDISSGCAGELTLQPGDSFYVWARLMTWGRFGGEADAADTFRVAISPELDSQARAEFVAGLKVASVPDPAAWAVMLLGFACVGAAVRRRRHAAA